MRDVEVGTQSRMRGNGVRLVVKGDKNQEIADQLGISVNSVKTLKYNALNILRKELTGSLLLLLAWFEVQG